MRKKKALGDLKRKKRLRKKNELKEQIIRKGKKKTGQEVKGGSKRENKEEKLRRRTTKKTKTIRKELRTRGNPNNNQPGPKSEDTGPWIASTRTGLFDFFLFLHKFIRLSLVKADACGCAKN